MGAIKWEDECAPDCPERAECTEVGVGHTMCGTCVCGTPRHHCIDRSHRGGVVSTARDYLAAVQQRADAATDGPWAIVTGAFDVEVYGNEGKQYVAHTGDRGFVTAHLDAEFIAASRADVPRLVAFALAMLDLADELWKFEDENTDRAEGKAAAAAAIRHLAEQALTPKENDS